MLKGKRFVRKRMLALVPAVGLIALGVAGCTATGGGYIDSVTGADKATFGFTWQGTQNGGVLKGSYRDGPVKFRLDNGASISGFFECGGGTARYVSTSKNAPGSGTVSVSLCDYGEPGPTEGDTLTVDVQSGPYSWYYNHDTLEGGNLQVKGNS
jgi:hypothetical protein